LVRWLDSGNWQAQEPDHWCGACAIGQRLEHKARISYLTQPVREALPIDGTQRALEIAVLEEMRRR
jgi:hypothetical protein